jgi:hypothetical protein
LPQKNWNQNPRRALKTERAGQNISKIFRLFEVVDAQMAQPAGGNDAETKAKQLRPAKLEHSFGSPGFGR